MLKRAYNMYNPQPLSAWNVNEACHRAVKRWASDCMLEADLFRLFTDNYSYEAVFNGADAYYRVFLRQNFTIERSVHENIYQKIVHRLLVAVDLELKLRVSPQDTDQLRAWIEPNDVGLQVVITDGPVIGSDDQCGICLDGAKAVAALDFLLKTPLFYTLEELRDELLGIKRKT